MEKENGQLVVSSPIGVNYADVKQFETLQRVCDMLSKSDFVPEQFKAVGKDRCKAVANCMIALDMSQRIGASPIMVMNNLYQVHGKMSWSAAFLVSTINACGKYEPLQYGVEDVTPKELVFNSKKIKNLSCYAYTYLKGTKQLLRGSTITVDMAIKEGWYGKNGSKWQTMPEQMLKYRAAAFWCRTFAPELSMGLYTREEMEDVQYVEVKEQEPQSISNKAAEIIKEAKKEVQADNTQEKKTKAPETIIEQTGEVKEEIKANSNTNQEECPFE